MGPVRSNGGVASAAAAAGQQQAGHQGAGASAVQLQQGGGATGPGPAGSPAGDTGGPSRPAARQSLPGTLQILDNAGTGWGPARGHQPAYVRVRDASDRANIPKRRLAMIFGGGEDNIPETIHMHQLAILGIFCPRLKPSKQRRQMDGLDIPNAVHKQLRLYLQQTANGERPNKTNIVVLQRMAFNGVLSSNALGVRFLASRHKTKEIEAEADLQPSAVKPQPSKRSSGSGSRPAKRQKTPPHTNAGPSAAAPSPRPGSQAAGAAAAGAAPASLCTGTASAAAADTLNLLRSFTRAADAPATPPDRTGPAADAAAATVAVVPAERSCAAAAPRPAAAADSPQQPPPDQQSAEPAVPAGPVQDAAGQEDQGRPSGSGAGRAASVADGRCDSDAAATSVAVAPQQPAAPAPQQPAQQPEAQEPGRAASGLINAAAPQNGAAAGGAEVEEQVEVEEQDDWLAACHAGVAFLQRVVEGDPTDARRVALATKTYHTLEQMAAYSNLGGGGPPTQ